MQQGWSQRQWPSITINWRPEFSETIYCICITWRIMFMLSNNKSYDKYGSSSLQPMFKVTADGNLYAALYRLITRSKACSHFAHDNFKCFALEEYSYLLRILFPELHSAIWQAMVPPNTWATATWANADLDVWYHIASHGHIELNLTLQLLVQLMKFIAT